MRSRIRADARSRRATFLCGFRSPTNTIVGGSARGAAPSARREPRAVDAERRHVDAGGIEPREERSASPRVNPEMQNTARARSPMARAHAHGQRAPVAGELRARSAA